MDLKKATTLASVTVMTFMLAGGYFVKVNYIQLMIQKQDYKQFFFNNIVHCSYLPFSPHSDML